VKRMSFAEFVADPMTQLATENAQYGGGEERRDGGEEEEHSAKLAMEKAGLDGVLIDDVDAVHDQFHDLGAGDECASPADDSPLPGLRGALDEELGDDLTAAGRQVFREVGDEVEQVSVAAPTAGGNGDDEQ